MYVNIAIENIWCSYFTEEGKLWDRTRNLNLLHLVDAYYIQLKNLIEINVKFSTHSTKFGNFTAIDTSSLWG